MTLEFNEENHEYRYEGRLVPSVTQVLKSANISPQFYSNNEAAERGTLVHKACEILDDEDLDENTLHEELKPYVSCYKDFVSDLDAEVIFNEIKIYNSVYDYAGSLDKIIKINGKNYLVDLKTGLNQEWHKIQVSAYEKAYENKVNKVKIDFCSLLYLTPQKKTPYKFITIKNTDNYFDIFKAALKVHFFKENGID